MGLQARPKLHYRLPADCRVLGTKCGKLLWSLTGLRYICAVKTKPQSSLLKTEVEVEVNFDRQSVGHSVLVSGAHLWPVTNFFSPWNFLQAVAALIFCSALSDERTGLGWKFPQNSPLYFTVSSETLPTWRARFPYLYRPGTGWPSYTPRNFFLNIYKNSSRTSQETRYFSSTVANWLMLLKETAAVNYEDHTKHKNTLCRQNAEF
jgi:hypothetical protein